MVEPAAQVVQLGLGLPPVLVLPPADQRPREQAKQLIPPYPGLQTDEQSSTMGEQGAWQCGWNAQHSPVTHAPEARDPSYATCSRHPQSPAVQYAERAAARRWRPDA